MQKSHFLFELRAMDTSALDRLADTEICIVILHDGRKFEAEWDLAKRRFNFRDGSGSISPVEVYEWMLAGVKF